MKNNKIRLERPDGVWICSKTAAEKLGHTTTTGICSIVKTNNEFWKGNVAYVKTRGRKRLLVKEEILDKYIKDNGYDVDRDTIEIVW